MSDERRHWVPAYVGLGSNLGDPARQVGEAIERLSDVPESRLVASSHLYRSQPMGRPDQPDFVNAVACLLTALSARSLLEALLEIETAAGRRRNGERWGPRVLDLDLLLYGQRKIDEPGLRVPHPGIAERNFVLFPLREIAPYAHVPEVGTVAGLAARFPVDGTDITRLDR